MATGRDVVGDVVRLDERRQDVVAQVVDVRALVAGYLPEQPVEAHLDGLHATPDEPVGVEQQVTPALG